MTLKELRNFTPTQKIKIVDDNWCTVFNGTITGLNDVNFIDCPVKNICTSISNPDTLVVNISIRKNRKIALSDIRRTFKFKNGSRMDSEFKKLSWACDVIGKSVKVVPIQNMVNNDIEYREATIVGEPSDIRDALDLLMPFYETFVINNGD